MPTRRPDKPDKLMLTSQFASWSGGAYSRESGGVGVSHLGRPGLHGLRFDDIYRSFYDDVRRWTRVLGGPEADREDLAQDVFLIVHRRLREFDGQNLPGWLFQITRHRVRDFRRLRSSRLLLGHSFVEESIVSPAAGPDAVLRNKQNADMLEQFLSKLPKPQRAAFVLFEIEGRSGKEIARLQRVSVNTVWARIRNARVKLMARAALLG